MADAGDNSTPNARLIPTPAKASRTRCRRAEPESGHDVAVACERDDHRLTDDLSWDEVVVMFESAAPVEVERGARTLHIEYRRRFGGWRGTSPDIPGFDVLGGSLADTKQRVRDDLAGWLDSGVAVTECTITAPKAVAVPLLLLIRGGGQSLSDAPMSATTISAVGA